MDIILNELSLKGQFSTDNEFLDNLAGIIKLTQLINQLSNVELFKSHNIWDSEVTSTKNLLTLLRTKGNDILNKLRFDLSKLSSSPPYWEEGKLHSCPSNTYIYNSIDICNTGLAESSERNKAIISFAEESYINSIITIQKNSQNIDINNFIDLPIFAQYLYKNTIIDAYDFCKYYFYNTKLNFLELDKEKHAFRQLQKNDIKLFINQFKLFTETTWENIPNSDGLKYKKYNNVLIGFEGIDIYKFRITEKFRCYGYREDETFNILYLEVNHKASDNG